MAEPAAEERAKEWKVPRCDAGSELDVRPDSRGNLGDWVEVRNGQKKTCARAAREVETNR